MRRMDSQRCTWPHRRTTLTLSSTYLQTARCRQSPQRYVLHTVTRERLLNGFGQGEKVRKGIFGLNFRTLWSDTVPRSTRNHVVKFCCHLVLLFYWHESNISASRNTASVGNIMAAQANAYLSDTGNNAQICAPVVHCLIISANEVMFYPAFVCLFVCLSVGNLV